MFAVPRLHPPKTCTALACATLVFALLMAQALQAATYRWVDDDGVVNYSERKPQGVPEERIAVVALRSAPSSAPADPAPVETPSPDELTPDQRDMLAELEAQETERQATIAQIRQENCQKSRDMLERLTVRSRIRVTMPDGTQRALPEEERQERIEQAQMGIVRNCDS